MPAEQLGSRYSVVATKAGTHGAPAVEYGHAGVAAKSTQAAPAYPSAANALLAQQFAIGEEIVIMLDGAHEILNSALPVGAAAGNPLYIKAADNSLVLAATALDVNGVVKAGYTKFGLISAIDTVAGRSLVNLNQRSSF